MNTDASFHDGLTSVKNMNTELMATTTVGAVLLLTGLLVIFFLGRRRTKVRRNFCSNAFDFSPTNGVRYLLNQLII